MLRKNSYRSLSFFTCAQEVASTAVPPAIGVKKMSG
ncbi:MAG: hypothetical protein ACI906_004840, partial [Candidatus Latescibacterota bacterium]